MRHMNLITGIGIFVCCAFAAYHLAYDADLRTELSLWTMIIVSVGRASWYVETWIDSRKAETLS
jgi:hypothetical protein